MIDGDLFDLIRRGVAALERIADGLNHAETPRPRQPAILSTATYTREEREQKEFAAFEASQPKR